MLKSQKSGFTIVELLIVIVVIAILAAISIVAYNGIQTRAQDTRLKLGASEFAKALQAWAVDNGSTLKGNSGSTVAIANGECADGGGSGFVGKTVYACTLEEMLQAKGFLPENFVANLPGNIPRGSPTSGRLSMMIYPCSTGGYTLMWHLKNPTAEETASFNSLLTQCGHGTSVRDSHGMRAGKVLNI